MIIQQYGTGSRSLLEPYSQPGTVLSIRRMRRANGSVFQKRTAEMAAEERQGSGSTRRTG